jgi:hypothetical protein
MTRARKTSRGERFGRLVAIRPTGRDKYGHALWLFRCDCRNEIVTSISYVSSGDTRSCGCLRKETATALASQRTGRNHPSFKHGQTHTFHGYTHPSPTYQVWQNMIQRCTNPHAKRWSYYGGANPPVRICKRWRGEHGFEHFLADLGEKPNKKTIGRYLDAGNYEPANVMWMTDAQQKAEARGKRARLAFRALRNTRRAA